MSEVTMTAAQRVAQEAERLAERDRLAEDGQAARSALQARDAARSDHERRAAQQQHSGRVERARESARVAGVAAGEAQAAARFAANAIRDFERRHRERRDVVADKAAGAVEHARDRADAARDELARYWCQTPTAEPRLPDNLAALFVAAHAPGFADWLSGAQLDWSPLDSEQVAERRRAARAHEHEAQEATQRSAAAAAAASQAVSSVEFGDGDPELAAQHAADALDARDRARSAADRARAALDVDSTNPKESL
jgi:hypothetical protein